LQTLNAASTELWHTLKILFFTPHLIPIDADIREHNGKILVRMLEGKDFLTDEEIVVVKMLAEQLVTGQTADAKIDQKLFTAVDQILKAKLKTPRWRQPIPSLSKL
jgi:hypothetical protein